STNVTFTIDTQSPTITLNSPPDNAVDVDGNIIFNCSASDNLGLLKIELYFNGTLNQSINVSGIFNNTIFYLYGLANGNYSWNCKAYDVSGNSNYLNRILIVDTNAMPSSSNFSGNTTDWTNVPDISNVCNGTAILDTNYGQIQWQDCVNASYQNFDANVNISDNFIEVNFGLNPSFNSSATLTFRNLPYDATPEILMNGVICGEVCQNISYNATTGILTFNVLHFTNFTTIGNSQLTIWDQNDSGMPGGNLPACVNSLIKFFANYSKTANGNPITGATCIINFTDSIGNAMAYNTTSTYYEYNRTFSSTGVKIYNITCSKTGFQTITLSDSVNISDCDAPTITLNSPAQGFSTTATSINFSWTALDNLDSNLSCNLTIDGIVNVSNIESLNSTPTNQTVSGFVVGSHQWNVTCWDDSNNINTSETRNFSIIQVGGGGAGGGGGEGGAGGGAGGRVRVRTPSLLEEKKCDLIMLEEKRLVTCFGLKEKQVLHFTYQKVNHTIIIDKINYNSIEITIYSLPVAFTIKANETKQVDLDNDDIYDIEITLDSLDYENKSASLTVKIIECKCPECSEWSECVDEKQTKTCYRCNKFKKCEAYKETRDCVIEKPSKVKSGKWELTVIILLLIIILAIIKLITTHKHKETTSRVKILFTPKTKFQ
ncbi:MAG: Ig-like domain-containing protein, partial [Candidatus Pacearchaeota archaeon]